MLQSDLCDYSDAHIVVKGTFTVERSDNNAYDQKLDFKSNAPIISCISKINNKIVDDAEDLHVVMPMYNLLEYNKNYSKTSGSLWNYYRDEPNSAAVRNIIYSIIDSKLFHYETSVTGKSECNNAEKENVGIVLALKYLSNFWRTLEIPLINCEVSLKYLYMA